MRLVYKTQHPCHSAKYSVHCTKYNVQGTLYTLQSTLYTVHSTLCTLQSTMYIVHHLGRYLMSSLLRMVTNTLLHNRFGLPATRVLGT